VHVQVEERPAAAGHREAGPREPFAVLDRQVVAEADHGDHDGDVDRDEERLGEHRGRLDGHGGDAGDHHHQHPPRHEGVHWPQVAVRSLGVTGGTTPT
jgi:hypothetical protein